MQDQEQTGTEGLNAWANKRAIEIFNRILKSIRNHSDKQPRNRGELN